MRLQELRLLACGAISQCVATKQTFGKPSGINRAAFSLIGVREPLACCHCESRRLADEGADAVGSYQCAPADFDSRQLAFVDQTVNRRVSDAQRLLRIFNRYCNRVHVLPPECRGIPAGDNVAMLTAAEAHTR